LFKSGMETFGKDKRTRRTLKFRQFIGDIKDPPGEPDDRGYYYKMPNSYSQIIHFVFRDNGFLETKGKNWTVMWNVGSPKSEVFNNMASWQKVNHFPRACEITRKDSMNINMGKMQLKHGKNYSFIPKTYLLPQELALIISDHDKAKHKRKWYIIKPTASSQGRGIQVTCDVEDVTFFVSRKDYETEFKRHNSESLYQRPSPNQWLQI
jgi:hypothetical protein